MFWFGFAEDNPRSPIVPPDDQVRYQDLQGQPAPEEAYDPMDKESVGHEVNSAAILVLPWVISVMLHVGMVLLAVFAVWSTQTIVEEEEVIIPIATLSQTPGTPVTQRTSTRTPSTTATTSQSRSVASSTQAAEASLSTDVSTSTNALIGIQGGASAGQVSPFGMGASSQAQFQATFMGTGGNARRIIYLIDASGSLIDTLPFVILELKRSIGELSERQSFTVIFFQGSEALEVPPRGLKAATGARKQDVIKWIDVDAQNIVPIGATNPIKALTLALTYRPQLIFLLSDNITGQGRYEVDQRRLLREIAQTNKSNTKINTIQFIYPDPLAELGMEPTMKMIAENTSGIYKFMDARELGIQ